MAPPRGDGREVLLSAAASRMARLSLRDLMATVGPKRVAETAGVTQGTCTHHFPSKEKLHEELVGFVLDSFLASDAYGRLRSTLLRFGADGGGDLRELVAAVAGQLQRLDPRADGGVARSDVVLYHLLAAAAPHDPGAARPAREYLAALRARHVELLRLFLEVSGRRERADVPVERLAVAVLALTDGFVLARRVDPATAPVQLYADVLLRLLLSCTVDPTGSEPDSVDTLAARVGAAPPPLTEVDRQRITVAAGRIYAQSGWEGLTLEEVAQQAGVDRTAVVRLLGDRRGLAAAVWSAQNMPMLETVATAAAAHPDVRGVVFSYLHMLAQQARRDQALTAHLIEAVFAHTVRASDGRPLIGDVRFLVPVPHRLAPLLRARAEQLREGEADTEVAAFDAAALLCNATLHLAFTRPLLSPAAVADRICDTTLLGLRQPLP
jgi:AcrR family transcriptional regulator